MGRIRKIREDVKKVVTYKFVISRSAVQFRPLAPYKTMSYSLEGWKILPIQTDVMI